jgi:hypothetical protein
MRPANQQQPLRSHGRRPNAEWMSTESRATWPKKKPVQNGYFVLCSDGNGILISAPTPWCSMPAVGSVWGPEEAHQMPSPRCRDKRRGWALQENGRNLLSPSVLSVRGRRTLTRHAGCSSVPATTHLLSFPITGDGAWPDGRELVLGKTRGRRSWGPARYPAREPNPQTRRHPPFLMLPFWPFWELVEHIFPCERRQPAFSRHAGVCGGDQSGVKVITG